MKDPQYKTEQTGEPEASHYQKIKDEDVKIEDGMSKSHWRHPDEILLPQTKTKTT